MRKEDSMNMLAETQTFIYRAATNSYFHYHNITFESSCLVYEMSKRVKTLHHIFSDAKILKKLVLSEEIQLYIIYYKEKQQIPLFDRLKKKLSLFA